MTSNNISAAFMMIAVGGQHDRGRLHAFDIEYDDISVSIL